jgi:hypothetical protein
MINKLLLTSGNQWNIIYVFIETLHTYSLRIEILVAIDFFSPFVLFKKITQHLLCLLHVLLL